MMNGSTCVLLHHMHNNRVLQRPTKQTTKQTTTTAEMTARNAAASELGGNDDARAAASFRIGDFCDPKQQRPHRPTTATVQRKRFHASSWASERDGDGDGDGMEPRF